MSLYAMVRFVNHSNLHMMDHTKFQSAQESTSSLTSRVGDTISLDCFKSAHLDNNIDSETNITPSAAPPATTESQSTTPTRTRVTRSGHVQYPVCFSK